MTETRIVLVKPGDTLVFGNVGDSWSEMHRESLEHALSTLRFYLDLKTVIAFAEDIDMAAVEGGA